MRSPTCRRTGSWTASTFWDAAGYIKLRHVTTREELHLEDADDYTDLEAKVTATGIRLLGGEIHDRMVDA